MRRDLRNVHGHWRRHLSRADGYSISLSNHAAERHVWAFRARICIFSSETFTRGRRCRLIKDTMRSWEKNANVSNGDATDVWYHGTVQTLRMSVARARVRSDVLSEVFRRGPLRRKRAHQRLCWRGSSRLGVFGGCERRLMPPCSPPSRNLWLISSSFSSVRAWASRDRYRDYDACAPNNSAGRATAHRPTRRRPPASSDCSRASRHVCAGKSARRRKRQRRRACAGERAAAASIRASVESRQSGVEVRVAHTGEAARSPPCARTDCVRSSAARVRRRVGGASGGGTGRRPRSRRQGQPAC